MIFTKTKTKMSMDKEKGFESLTASSELGAKNY